MRPPGKWSASAFPFPTDRAFGLRDPGALFAFEGTGSPKASRSPKNSAAGPTCRRRAEAGEQSPAGQDHRSDHAKKLAGE